MLGGLDEELGKQRFLLLAKKCGEEKTIEMKKNEK